MGKTSAVPHAKRRIPKAMGAAFEWVALPQLEEQRGLRIKADASSYSVSHLACLSLASSRDSDSPSASVWELAEEGWSSLHNKRSSSELSTSSSWDADVEEEGCDEGSGRSRALSGRMASTSGSSVQSHVPRRTQRLPLASISLSIWDDEENDVEQEPAGSPLIEEVQISESVPVQNLETKDGLGLVKASQGKSRFHLNLGQSKGKGKQRSWQEKVGGVLKQVAIFSLEVAALAGARHVAQKTYPPLWQGFQGLCYTQVPPISKLVDRTKAGPYLQPLKELTRPLLVLSSIATALEVLHEQPDAQGRQTRQGNAPASPDSRELVVVERPQWEPELQELRTLKEELFARGIQLPDRFDDSELRYHLRSADFNIARCLKRVKASARWWTSQAFLTQEQLQPWEDLVFWHGVDVCNRPCLVVRLGRAHQTLSATALKDFAHAIVSQVEHGARALVAAGTSRESFSIVADCRGVHMMNVPVMLMKNTATLLQHHYPRRLASAHVLGVSGFLQFVTNTVLQVCSPITRQKVRVSGERFQGVLDEELGGSGFVPAVLGGQCTCEKCVASPDNPAYRVGPPHMRDEVAQTSEEVVPFERAQGDMQVYSENAERTWPLIKIFLVLLLLAPLLLKLLVPPTVVVNVA